MGAVSQSVSRAPLSGNFALVQALRGLAAFWVVLFHASEGHHIDALRRAMPAFINSLIFDAGHFGVAIFFALSGFVIAHSVAGDTITPNYAARFFLRRSIRLDPPYWAAIILVLGLQALASIAAHVPAQPVSATQIAAHIIYGQQLLGIAQINPVFWTLAFEIQFYLAFVLALMLARLAGGRWTLAAVQVVMALAALVSAFGGWSSLPAGLFLQLWHAFFVGVLAYWSAQGSRHWLAALAVIGGAMIIHNPDENMFGLISAGTAIMLLLASRTRWLSQGLNSQPWQALGMISYSLYLTHNPLTGAGYFIGSRILGHSVLAETVQFFAVTTFCVVGAYAFWWLIERPSHRLARRIAYVKLGAAEYAGAQPAPAPAINASYQPTRSYSSSSTDQQR
jgi:peptidoglycan/LPS O-acetylase OafA/YrhL